MKTILLFLAIITSTLANSQALIASVELDLQKPKNRHEFFQFANPKSNELFVFAADKSNLYALHYNSALFFRDSLKTSRPDRDADFIAGFSFNRNENPGIYWASESFKTVRATVFDFETKQINTASFDLNLRDERLIGNISTNGSFHLVTVPQDRDSLNIFKFSGTTMERYSVDLSSIVFKDKNREISLHKLFLEYPPQYIDSEILNPLVFATSKIKYYTIGTELIITFDHELYQTHILSVDLNDFSFSESKLAQPVLASGPGNSNSFVEAREVYQLKTNLNEITLAIKNRKSGEQVTTFSASDSDDFSARNSPYLQQTANLPAREIRNTKRFLKLLSSTEPGINVYQYSDRKLITVGGTTFVPSTGNIIIGVAAGAGMVIGGGDVDLSGLINSNNLRNVFFEMQLDSANTHLPEVQDLLAADKIQNFLNENPGIEITMLTPYKDDFVLGYYSYSEKKYIVRRFYDGEDF